MIHPVRQGHAANSLVNKAHFSKPRVVKELEVKELIKGLIKSMGIVDVRFVKVNLEGGSVPRVHIALYVDKPIPMDLINSIINEVSNKLGVKKWSIYAPHGKLIRLSGILTHSGS